MFLPEDKVFTYQSSRAYGETTKLTNVAIVHCRRLV
jgi:hypothetical protein